MQEYLELPLHVSGVEIGASSSESQFHLTHWVLQFCILHAVALWQETVVSLTPRQIHIDKKPYTGKMSRSFSA